MDIGDKVAKGQVLAVISIPDLDAEAEQKLATVEESEAKLAQAKASQEVAQANLASSQAKLVEVQAGIKRVDADLARWRAEYKRIEQLFNAPLKPEACSMRPGASSGHPSRRVTRYTPRSNQPRPPSRHGEAMLDKARSDVTAAAASIKVARSDARRSGPAKVRHNRCSLSTASSRGTMWMSAT